MKSRWVPLALVVVAYGVLIVGFYDVPYGGPFNRDDAGSVADWTAGAATTATLVYLVLQRNEDRQREREAEYQSVVLVVSHGVFEDPLLENPVRATVELRHLGRRPVYRVCLQVHHGELAEKVEVATALPEGHGDEPVRAILSVSQDRFDDALLTAEATWDDVWGQPRWLRWTAERPVNG